MLSVAGSSPLCLEPLFEVVVYSFDLDFELVLLEVVAFWAAFVSLDVDSEFDLDLDCGLEFDLLIAFESVSFSFTFFELFPEALTFLWDYWLPTDLSWLSESFLDVLPCEEAWWFTLSAGVGETSFFVSLTVINFLEAFDSVFEGVAFLAEDLPLDSVFD